MIRRNFNLMAGAALLAAVLMGASPTSAQNKKVTIALPGIPPVFSVTIAYVAEKQGFFKKHGVDVASTESGHRTAERAFALDRTDAEHPFVETRLQEPSVRRAVLHQQQIDCVRHPPHLLFR